MVKSPLQCWRPRLEPWVGNIPWRTAWLPTPVFLPGESHGQRSLAGYSPWGQKKSDTTEQLTYFYLVLYVSKNASNVSSVNKMLALGPKNIYVIIIIILRKYLSNLVSNFYQERFWILPKTFTASVEIIIKCLPGSVKMCIIFMDFQILNQLCFPGITHT